MKHSVWILVAVALLFCAPGLNAQRAIWATAYYTGWMQGYLVPANVDFNACTQINHFALVPNADGTLNDAANSVTAAAASAITTAAHAAGKKVLITVGGWDTESLFLSATTYLNRAKFVHNLVALLRSRNYDGIDIDWEGLYAPDDSLYTAFIRQLRDSLDTVNPRPLLTAATAWSPGIIAKVADKIDQINIMTYDMSGPWGGWITWHNAPIYNGGHKFPSTGGYVPSTDGWVGDFVAAGIPIAKLGIGIDFYGYIWSGGDGMPDGGATGPAQSWTTAPPEVVQRPVLQPDGYLR